MDQDFHGAFTLVVPDLRPRRFSWALLRAVTVNRLLLGRKDDGTVLLFPSRPVLCACLVVVHPAVGLKFPHFLWSFSRFHGLGKLLIAAVHVYIQMLLMLTFARHVECPPCLLSHLFSKDEMLWMRRQFRDTSRVLSLLLAANPISVRSRLWSNNFPRSSSQFFRLRLFRLCIADDMVRFLIHKDKSGRTVVHASDCSRLPCKCLRHLAAGTVDSLASSDPSLMVSAASILPALSLIHALGNI